MFTSNLFGPKYFTPLSTAEVEKLKQLETDIASENFNAAIATLKDMYQEDIVRFCRYSSNGGLVKFCETNPTIQETWKDTITKYYKATPTFSLESQESKENHPTFHHYVSAYILNSYLSYYHAKEVNNNALLKSQVATLLHDACQWGSYFALIESCHIHREALFSGNPDPQLVLNDAFRLSHLYGEIGYVQAGCALLDVSCYYSGIGETTMMMDYFEQGVKNFLCALALKSHPESQQLTACLTNGEGLISTFEADKNSSTIAEIFNDSVKAKIMLKSWLRNNDDLFNMLDKSAKTETDLIISANKTSIKQDTLS